jgi:hypothetical protein
MPPWAGDGGTLWPLQPGRTAKGRGDNFTRGVPGILPGANQPDFLNISQVIDLFGCPPGIRTPIDRFRADCPTIERGGKKSVEMRALSREQGVR